MNLQSLMKQAQSMQKNIMDKKKEVENQKFEGESELIKAIVNGKKELISLEIKQLESFDKDDIEILQDMIVIAVNAANKKVDDEMHKKLGNQIGAFGDLL